MPAANPHQLSALVKSLAREVGFDLVGNTRAAASDRADEYRAWLATGKHGAMAYLAKGAEERVDITRKFPWARSVVCVALAYFQEKQEAGREKQEGETRNPKSEIRNPEADQAGENLTGKIARYAWGRDYHKVVEGKLARMERRLRETLTPGPGEAALQTRSYCDTGPILERELSARAGLGWIGKHTLLIHPRHGSWFVLGEIVLSVELEPDSPLADHCGTCRRCIEACPTDAITPYSVDATKCISYLTLENRGTIAEEFHAPMREAGFIAGCDICQEVCPFNRQPLVAREPDFAARAPAPLVSLKVVQDWSEQEWDVATRGRAFRRAKFTMWKRNAEIMAEGKR